MIQQTVLWFVLLGSIVLTLSYNVERSSDIEAKARKFLRQTSYKLFKFYDQNADKAFADPLTAVPYSLHEANENYSIFLKKIVEDSRKFDYKNFKDEKLKYAFEILAKEADEKIIGKDRFLELVFSLDELEILMEEDTIIQFEDDEENEIAYSPDIQNIIRKSNNSEELEYYWTSWNEQLGMWADTNLHTTLETLKDAARLSEMSSLEFWSRGFNITDMENLMNEIKPLYQQIHAFVRKLIQMQYGEDLIPSDGLIPDHLYTQFRLQIMTNESPIEELFPHESLPPIHTVIREKFNAEQLYKIAENFFVQLGFETYPGWGDRIRMSKSTGCEARVWHWTPSIYLEFCKKMNFWGFLDAYANMAYIYYAKEMTGLPAYFFNAPNGLDIAIGKAVVLSSSTHHNLKAVGLIPDEFNITEDVEMNRVLRMTIHRLMNIPLNFVHANVMVYLLSGNAIEPIKVNNYYWQLMELHAGIGPPENYVADIYDLPKIFYEQMNENYMSSEFTTEILSYQIYKKLCELSGKYPREPLHLCDINGSKDAGNALKKMMQLGTSEPFYKVLATMFPENPTVRSEGILEYYEPFNKFLIEMNKRANVTPGWNISDSE